MKSFERIQSSAIYRGYMGGTAGRNFGFHER
jgi:hypothetical protein